MSRATSLAVHVACGAVACAGSTFEDGIYRGGDIAFQVGRLSPSWRRVDAEGDLTFRSDGGTIYAYAVCDRTADAPLDVLTNHALFGVDVLREERRTVTLDGRAAMRTRLTGELHGVPVRMEIVVLRKGGCTYDLGLVTAPDRFQEKRPDFVRFVREFRAFDRERES